jgi:hypothetical protein
MRQPIRATTPTTRPAIIAGEISLCCLCVVELYDALADGNVDSEELLGRTTIVDGIAWHVLLRVTKLPFSITTAVAPSFNTCASNVATQRREDEVNVVVIGTVTSWLVGFVSVFDDCVDVDDILLVV